MTNSIVIHRATESEAVALGRINILSFQHHQSWANLAPDMEPIACFPMMHVRTLQLMIRPDTHIFSAVDTSDDQVVGYGRWVIPGEESSIVELSAEGQALVADGEKVKPEGMRWDIFVAFLNKLKGRREVYTTEHDMVLDLLATRPGHGGKGVGTTLLQWGIEYADAHNRRIYLEATVDGCPLYLKHGWRKLEEVVIDYGEFGGKGQQAFTLMMRDPHSSSAS
ncbi:acyl-CoA N-acyltransferase [Aspergillus avenaceus]|uniref:Acyl-CoA N-acyltransferase n=1 Tax=Aspergillus avenaceus TaxID=36643 RepID=A0A5N6TX02_ASPAV|nr:acyl-CoA N-acyltransferase [Aspergillus avenaceus]